MFYSSSQHSWQGAQPSFSQNADSGGLGLGGARMQSASQQERPFSANAGVKPFAATAGFANTARPSSQLTNNRPFSAIQRPSSAPTKIPLSLAAALAPRQPPQHTVLAPSPSSSQHFATQPTEHNWTQPNNMLGSQQHDFLACQPMQPRPGSVSSAMDQLPARPGSAPAAQSSMLALTHAHRHAAQQAPGQVPAPAWNSIPDSSQQTLGSILTTEAEFKRTTQALEALQTQVNTLQDSHALLCTELSTISRQYQELASLHLVCKDVAALMQGMENRLESQMQQTQDLHVKADEHHQVVVRELHAASAAQQQLMVRELQATQQAITTCQQQHQHQQVTARVVHEAMAQTSPDLAQAGRASAEYLGHGGQGTGWQQRRTSKRHSIVVSYTRLEYQEEEQHMEQCVRMDNCVRHGNDARDAARMCNMQRDSRAAPVKHAPVPAPAVVDGSAKTGAVVAEPPAHQPVASRQGNNQHTAKGTSAAAENGWVQRKRGNRSTPGSSTDGSSGMHAITPVVPVNHQDGTAGPVQRDVQVQLQQVGQAPPKRNSGSRLPSIRPASARAVLPGTQPPASHQPTATQRLLRSNPLPVRMPSQSPRQPTPVGAAAWLAGAEPPAYTATQRRPFDRATGSLLQASGQGHTARATFSQCTGKGLQASGAVGRTACLVQPVLGCGSRGCDGSGHLSGSSGELGSAGMQDMPVGDHVHEVDDQALAKEVAEQLNRHRMRKLRRL